MRGLPPRRSALRFASFPQVYHQTAAPSDVGAPGDSRVHVARTDHDRPRLTLFGGPLLQRSPGVPVLLTPSHERLLTLVWGHEERGISRTSAIWLLWEEEDTPRSRQRLRQLLHDLGTRLGFRPLAGQGESRLAPGAGFVDSDLDDYHRALTTHELRKAHSLFRLGFAARLDGRTGGEEYEDWLLSKREALRRRLGEAAARGWDQARPAGAWPEALEAAEVLAALDPGSEATVTKLVEARAVTGSLQGAEQAVADFLARLPVGSVPSREATALFQRIRRMDPARIGSGPVSRLQPPLVGRRQALQVARGALDRVASGSFEFLLLRGEGGAGKTRLMEELRKEATVAGFRCLEARPVELERRIPLNPLVDMLGDPSVAPHLRALGEPWRAVIASLLPTLPAGMDPPVVPPIAETSLSRRLYDAFATLFSEMAESGPHLLFLDDLHWADTTTLAVLQFVQRRWRSGPLGVVAAIRPDLVSGSDEVARYLTISPDLPVTAVELGDLTDDEARTLLDLVAGTELEPSAADRLLALGGRNPFYLIELTRDLVAGKVQLPELPTEAITLPISLRQLLEPRIQELGEAAANVASHLAVWGRAISLTELARLTYSSIEDTARQVEDLERSRLATVEQGRVSLGHELFRSTIYQGLTATRRSLLHGRVAEFLNEQEGQQPGETAIHFARAGHAAGAALRGREAADRALESGAMAEAAYFLRLVVENVGDALLKAEATADLARVLHMNREITRANPMLELAASRLRAVGRHDRALRMDIRRVEGLAELGAAPLSDLLDRLATIKSLARAANDDEALALALDSELHLLHRSGRVAEIRALFAEIRPVTASPDRAAACLANAALALNVLFGDADEALRCAREAVRIAEAGEGGPHRLLVYSRLTLVLIYQGLLATSEGRATIVKATSAAERSGDLTLRAYTELNQGVFAMEVGNFLRAGEHFENTARILGRSVPGLPHVTLLYNQGELLIQEGRYAEARDVLYRGESVCALTTPVYLTTLIAAGVGLCSLELGDLRVARERDGIIGPSLSPFYYDPTTIFDFRARLLLRRGRGADVLDDVEVAATTLRSRLPLVWMKLTELSGRIRSRMRMGPPPWIDEAVEEARGLPGFHRIDALERLRAR
jgi:DNA-binding SARP family transcriptional activator/tetratricopeptide (TPR) repeat protein